MVKTVGELKEFIKDLPDDMQILHESDNFELKGAIDIGIYPIVKNFKIEKKQFVDGFDYQRYYKEVYIPSQDGIECLQIN